MARKKTMELSSGETVFERQQPLEGLKLLEELTRPIKYVIGASIGAQRHVTRPAGKIDPKAVATE